MTIPLVDLNRQYEEIKDEVKEAMARIMESSAFILGEEVRQFENEFASFCGSRYASFTSGPHCGRGGERR